jgi:hypothetical protein
VPVPRAQSAPCSPASSSLVGHAAPPYIRPWPSPPKLTKRSAKCFAHYPRILEGPFSTRTIPGLLREESRGLSLLASERLCTYWPPMKTQQRFPSPGRIRTKVRRAAPRRLGSLGFRIIRARDLPASRVRPKLRVAIVRSKASSRPIVTSAAFRG